MNIFGRPDWVMCGVPYDGGVCILASTELSQAELEALRERPDVVDIFDADVRCAPTRYRLTVELDGFVIVYADTYAEALRSLFERWAPRPRTYAQLANPREITR